MSGNFDTAGTPKGPAAAAVQGWAIPDIPRGFYRGQGKRIVDIIGVLMLAPVALPLIGLIALALILSGTAPFYGHRRVGYRGRSFRCWKFQTMVPDAQARLDALLAADPQAAAEWSAHRKLSNDPRITGFGRILRATSLDELPQLWNVLTGEMSLVGPRPVTRDEILRYGPSAPSVLSVRPGLTGPWQVGGRNETGYDERIRLDLRYSMSVNFAADFIILLKTAKVVLERTGM